MVSAPTMSSAKAAAGLRDTSRLYSMPTTTTDRRPNAPLMTSVPTSVVSNSYGRARPTAYKLMSRARARPHLRSAPFVDDERSGRRRQYLERLQELDQGVLVVPRELLKRGPLLERFAGMAE